MSRHPLSLAIPDSFVEHHRPGDPKSHFVEVHVVVAAVVEADLDVYHLVSRKDTANRRFLDTLIDCLMYSLGMTPPLVSSENS